MKLDNVGRQYSIEIRHTKRINLVPRSPRQNLPSFLPSNSTKQDPIHIRLKLRPFPPFQHKKKETKGLGNLASRKENNKGRKPARSSRGVEKGGSSSARHLFRLVFLQLTSLMLVLCPPRGLGMCVCCVHKEKTVPSSVTQNIDKKYPNKSNASFNYSNTSVIALKVSNDGLATSLKASGATRGTTGPLAVDV